MRLFTTSVLPTTAACDWALLRTKKGGTVFGEFRFAERTIHHKLNQQTHLLQCNQTMYEHRKLWSCLGH